MGKSIHSFVGGELSLLKLGSVLAKNLVFWHYQVEKAVRYKPFVNFVYTYTLHPSVHMHDSEICDSRLSYLSAKSDSCSIWGELACDLVT